MRGFAGSLEGSVVSARGASSWRSGRPPRQWQWLSSSASGSSGGDEHEPIFRSSIYPGLGKPVHGLFQGRRSDQDIDLD